MNIQMEELTMKNHIRRMHAGMAMMLCLLMLVLMSTGAYACTAVYVGAQCSDDGTVILAKSNDYQDVWANYITINLDSFVYAVEP